MNSQFADSLTDRLGVARMSESQPIQTGRNQNTRPFVFETRSPFAKGFRLF